MRAELGRLARFGCVGASNTALTLALYAMLTGMGAPPDAASALAFGAGAANGWTWNRRWTFADRGVGRAALGRYVGVQGLAALVSGAGVALARADGVAKLAAEVVVLPAATALSYALVRRLVFGVRTA